MVVVVVEDMEAAVVDTIESVSGAAYNKGWVGIERYASMMMMMMLHMMMGCLNVGGRTGGCSNPNTAWKFITWIFMDIQFAMCI